MSQHPEPTGSLAQALELVSDGVARLDAEGRIQYVNPRMELLFRRPRRELLGANWWELTSYLAGTPADHELREAVAGTESRRVKVFHPPLYAWHEVWIAPSEEGALLVVRDVTDVARAKQQEAVREAVRDIVDRAPVAITILRGPEHRVEITNQFARQLLGGRDLEGQTVRNALPEVEEQGLIEILDDVYRTGRPFEGKAVPITYDRYGNGQMYTGAFDIVYQPISDIDGRVSGVLSISVEVVGSATGGGEEGERSQDEVH